MIKILSVGSKNAANSEYTYFKLNPDRPYCIGMGTDHFYMGVNNSIYWIKITKESKIVIAHSFRDIPFSYHSWSAIGHK
jgi:hypothetical protein